MLVEVEGLGLQLSRACFVLHCPPECCGSLLPFHFISLCLSKSKQLDMGGGGGLLDRIFTGGRHASLDGWPTPCQIR
eukprot:scaffold137206_cov17-Tisochrysis_lutea.AAC.1